MPALYHISKESMEGSILYPLNELKTIYPTAYEREVKKYVGRESLMERRIPILNCLWNDVIHLTAVHPEKVKKALIEVGWVYERKNYWIIEPSFLEKNKTVVFLYRTDEGYEPEDFIPFTASDLSKYEELPKETLDYFKKCVQVEKRKPLFYHRVPHILYKGVLDTSQLTKIYV